MLRSAGARLTLAADLRKSLRLSSMPEGEEKLGFQKERSGFSMSIH